MELFTEEVSHNILCVVGYSSCEVSVSHSVVCVFVRDIARPVLTNQNMLCQVHTQLSDGQITGCLTHRLYCSPLQI